MQTEKEQDRNETLFAVDVLLTESVGVKVGFTSIAEHKSEGDDEQLITKVVADLEQRK